jgi:STE24 endopeptidase
MRFTFRFLLSILLLLSALETLAAPIAADFPPGLQVPAGAQPGPGFDVDKATSAYLGLMSPAQRARSDAYFEGGYWLQLWNFLYGLAVAAVFMLTGLSQRMRDLAKRVSPRPWLYTLIYAAMWIVALFALSLPLGIYTDFIREHDYGLSEQPFGGWMADQLKGLGVGLVLAPPVIVAIYAAVRRAGARWWIGATAMVFVFNLLLTMIAPVFIAPLFNTYQPLPEGPTRAAVLALARGNGIPTEHVGWFDASKQTTRVSANVSGLWGTIRVSLNDNLLNKTSLPEIKAVLGHEMGHYVLNHSLRLTIYLSMVYAVMLALLHFGMDRALARWGAKLKLGDRGDPAALPIAVAILSVFSLVATPLLNSIIRQAETEADAYGLNAAREPYGFAMSAMRLSAYRKISPGPIEEMLFFDHPSGYNRVHRSMIWLKENPLPELAAEAAASSR